MRYITADRIFTGQDYFPENTVLVLTNEGIISDIFKAESVDESKIENLKGIICPGFINTHCHLELSHLKNSIPQKTGIVDFGLSVVRHRNDFSENEQHEAMLQANQEMRRQGIVAVGDISNTNASISVKKGSDLHYHTFVELIALNPERADMVFKQGKELAGEFEGRQLSVSLAPHAPYSVSLNLIERISDYCSSINRPTSIHNQESMAENEFFLTRSGDYLRLYETLKIPIDYFRATNKSSLQTIIKSLNRSVNTLLVHNTFSSKEDLVVANNLHQQIYWCLCPNANLYIENTLPDIQKMVANHCKLTLGTDSLASNYTLSIIEEINTILKYKPEIPLEILLKAATFSGAEFLGIEDRFGSFEKNRKCGVNLIEGNPGNYSVKKLA